MVVNSLVRLSPGVARAASVLLSVLLAACSSDGSTTPSGSRASVDAVTVNPASSQLGLGSTLQLRALALDSEGNEVAGRSTFWASADTAVAGVSADGMVTARRVGAVQIQAVVEWRPAYSFISVVAASVARVTVAPGSATLDPGATVKLQATTADENGAALADRLVFWQSSNDAVARVTSTGLVSAVGPGSATITATSESRTATATIAVNPGAVVTPPTGGGSTNPVPVDSVKVLPTDTSIVRGTTASFRATVFAGGKAVTGRTVVWGTATPDFLSINAGTGEVTALNAPGKEGDVNATVEGVRGSAKVRVLNKAAASVAVEPALQSLQVGQQVTLTALVRDADGQIVSDAAATFESSDAAVLLVTQLTPTTALVTAQKSGPASITVKAPPLAPQQLSVAVAAPAPVRAAAIDLSPATKSLTVGETQQLAASVRDAQGNPLTGRTVTWATDRADVARVDAGGLVTAVAPGAARITGTVEGVSASAAITVNAPAPVVAATVDVSPASG